MNEFWLRSDDEAGSDDSDSSEYSELEDSGDEEVSTWNVNKFEV